MLTSLIMDDNTSIKQAPSNNVTNDRKKNKEDRDLTLNPDALSAHLSNNLKTKLLSKKDELALALRIKQGDKKAFELFFNANLRLVVSNAKRYGKYSTIPLEDLISEGHFGLLIAIKKFDPEKGFRFSTYASLWIRQSITRAIYSQQRLVRYPTHIELVKTQINTLQREAKKLNIVLTIKEIASTLALTEDKVADILSLCFIEVSTSSPMNKDDEGGCLGDFLADPKDDVNENVKNNDDVNYAVNYAINRYLTKKEGVVLRLRFGIGCITKQSLSEIGTQLKLSKERIRQIEKIALNKLRMNSDLVWEDIN